MHLLSIYIQSLPRGDKRNIFVHNAGDQMWSTLTQLRCLARVHLGELAYLAPIVDAQGTAVIEQVRLNVMSNAEL